ncbi:MULTISPECIES: nickel ABC transporter permease [unclassified Lysinibacillus]|uniref:nickel ABC transporter permease n=1 Tax=unclassified Lysinibacillus TaxID=2636778 RepID=UPI002012639C|nr:MULTISPECIES: nickel ABC transporter permease [unclassified Lysinibacillus]MCL1698361.1 ABC transporter permease [Lysinibacillus sp. BPa_S21]MCL1702589.1 ABC transporter permease [Lysinibacillus sp. Bpr_S20]
MYESTWMFCLKRILTLPFVLLGVSILTFVFIRFVPVEPAEVMLRMARVAPTAEAIQALREELGTDKPFLLQYLLWVKGILHLDFGTSFVSKLPVAHELFAKLPATIELAVASFVLILGLSLPLGIISALYKHSIIDKIIRLLTIMSISIPTFWLGFLLLYLFSLKLGLFPTNGKGTLAHLVLPAFTLALPTIGLFVQFIRSTIIEELQQQYVQYAQLRGLKNSVILVRHVLRNAIIPLTTLLGMTLGNLLGGAVIVEQVFSWPGLGRYLIESIMNRDYPVVQCYVIIIAVIYVLVNLCTDVLHRLLDPHLMMKGRRA